MVYVRPHHVNPSPTLLCESLHFGDPLARRGLSVGHAHDQLLRSRELVTGANLHHRQPPGHGYPKLHVMCTFALTLALALSIGFLISAVPVTLGGFASALSFCAR